METSRNSSSLWNPVAKELSHITSSQRGLDRRLSRNPAKSGANPYTAHADAFRPLAPATRSCMATKYLVALIPSDNG